MTLSEFIAKASLELVNHPKRNIVQITIKLMDTDASNAEQALIEYDIDNVGFDANHNVLYLEFNTK